MNEDQYRREVQRQRRLAQQHLHAELSRVCVELGLPPRQWRLWRVEDRLDALRVSVAAFVAAVAGVRRGEAPSLYRYSRAVVVPRSALARSVPPLLSALGRRATCGEQS